MATVRYGNEFRTLRRFTARYFSSRNYVDLLPLLKEEVSALLTNLINEPESFEEHFDR